MSKNIIRTAVATALAGAGLALGAGLASADTIDTTPVPDGAYTFAAYTQAPPSFFPVAVGAVPATVTDGHLSLAGVPVPGVWLAASDPDGDGTLDGAIVMSGDNNLWYISR